MLYAVSSTVRGHTGGQLEVVRLGLPGLLTELAGSDSLPAPVLTKVLSLIQDSATWDPACRAEASPEDTPGSPCSALERRAERVAEKYEQGEELSGAERRLAERLGQAISAAQCDLNALGGAAVLLDEQEE